MGHRYPGRRLEDSPLPWAIISSSLQDFSLRWRVDYELRHFEHVAQHDAGSWNNTRDASLRDRANVDERARFAESVRVFLCFRAAWLSIGAVGVTWAER